MPKGPRNPAAARIFSAFVVCRFTRSHASVQGLFGYFGDDDNFSHEHDGTICWFVLPLLQQIIHLSISNNVFRNCYSSIDSCRRCIGCRCCCGKFYVLCIRMRIDLATCCWFFIIFFLSNFPSRASNSRPPVVMLAPRKLWWISKR